MSERDHQTTAAGSSSKTGRKLSPASKSALKVLLMGNELLEINHGKGSALLDEASQVLKQRNEDSAKAADSRENGSTAAGGEESSGTNKLDLSAKQDRRQEDSATALEQRSTEEIKRVVATLKQLRALKFSESEKVQFDEIDLEDGRGQLKELREVEFDGIDFEDDNMQLIEGEEEDFMQSLELINEAIKDYHHMGDGEEF